ncbi:glycolate oxidase iron-sulfur subunit [Gammaproteobacteria bacterium]
MPNPPIEIKTLLKEADQCVLCGMCLSSCPTYLKTRDEGESPRGRISLLVALARQELPPSPRLRAHVEHCLTCRACERMCPAETPYGRIIDTGRALLLQKAPPSLVSRLFRHVLLKKLLPSAQWLRGLGWALYLAQRTGLTYLAPLVGLGRLARLLPRVLPPRLFQPYYPAHGILRGRVALFTGCVASIADRNTLESALRVLTGLGYDVDIPPSQVCCGALHLHTGDPKGAQTLARQNQLAFSGSWDAILSTASGCGATLIEQLPIEDISAFLTRITWPTEVSFLPLQKRVAVHDPCSLSNVLRCAEAPYFLLQRIPGLTILRLSGHCCGAGGAHLLRSSHLSQSLLTDKIKTLQGLSPDILATSNIGCALHLRSGIRGPKPEILHPITLLARQMILPTRSK